MHSRVRLTIGLLEICGGLSGPVFLAIQVARSEPQVANHWLIACILLMYMLSLYAGFALCKNKLHGYTASIWVQLIQLPKIIFVPFVYTMSFGIDFVFLIQPNGSGQGTSFSVNTILFANHMRYNINPTLTPGLGVGLLSIVWLLLLRRSYIRLCSQSPGLTAT